MNRLYPLLPGLPGTFALSVLMLGACTSTPPVAEAPAPEDVTVPLLLSGEELEARLDDPSVVILHATRERDEYEAGHIPGARYVAVSSILTERNGIPNMLPDPEALQEVFEAAGVSDDSHVVVYGDWDGLSATRTFVTLEYLGHTRVSVLDGGLEAWRADGRALANEPEAVEPGSLTLRVRDDVAVDADWVRRARTDPAYRLVDARPQPQYLGTEGGDRARFPRWGHITGAGNVFWGETLEDGERPVFREMDDVRAMFGEAGAEPGRTVVAYCGTGVQASHGYFTARLLGYDARIYDGSFIDWSPRDESYPVTGPAE